ncbi:hypothetical protein [Spiroplasma turonicum]|uniref:Transmembrane protein n=1 Tax=Spiroplasma turonicum TaxID=216946 RepID=A0A0K1P6V9_9MOLU|nr:hypothetical protein [Spiroplasma turonicum]AKU80033.1 hypothetical protein STURON_00787 [Spiroplasma turonicum]ALX71035.1 hypothetical protein STURO_v1c07840 [Spiroplasma turonicum]
MKKVFLSIWKINIIGYLLLSITQIIILVFGIIDITYSIKNNKEPIIFSYNDLTIYIILFFFEVLIFQIRVKFIQVFKYNIETNKKIFITNLFMLFVPVVSFLSYIIFIIFNQKQFKLKSINLNNDETYNLISIGKYDEFKDKVAK